MAIDKQKFSQKVKDKYSFANETFSREVKSHPKDRIQVEIGDSKQPDFKPQFKVMRWDNEVNFSMRAEEHPSAVVDFEDEKIKYITPDYEVHQYDRPEVSEDGGFEFEWVLPKKPKTNVLTATIQTKGLDFFYQPALTPEEISEGVQRPEKVVGSYAVYHKTKGGMNNAAGMDYKVGKAFHIYRPEAIDSIGNKTWCELKVDISVGVLTVTIPNSFLDSSTYPVTVDPTFGNRTSGSTKSALQDPLSAAIGIIKDGIIATTGDTITKFTISAAKDVADVTIGLAAYAQVSSLPDTRLGNAVDTTTINSTIQAWWDTSSISQSMSNGTTYNVAFGNRSGNCYVWFDTGTGSERSAHSNYLLDSTWSSTGTSTTRYSAYATFIKIIDVPLAWLKA